MGESGGGRAGEPGSDRPTSLGELAVLFLRLGATAFGGPAAHISMMEDEVVRRRGWMDGARFLDLIGATNLIPGPNSTEMAMHVGWVRRGSVGLIVAGLAFILPATLFTSGLGWGYVRYGQLPSVGWLLYGVKPVILAVILQALWSLAPRAAKTPMLCAQGVLAGTLVWVAGHEVIVLFGMGAVSLLTAARRGGRGIRLPAWIPLLLPTAGGALISAVTLPSLFWVFLKCGSLLFGSGYVLVAFLRADLVERLGWLDESQLLDAIAVGQVTPGPLSTTATFIGWTLAGPGGAAVATLGMFLPAFVFVALSGPLVPRLRGSPAAAAFLDGVNVASLALMAVVTAQLGRTALVDGPTVALCLLSAAALLKWKPNSTWLVLGGAVVGFLLHRWGLADG